MFPIVVHEATVRVFNYYFEGQICQGMCCFRKFYRLVNTFSRRDRSQACTTAQALSHEEEQAVITASDQFYKVWLEIRSSVESEEGSVLDS
ncbi:MAG: hypothetical protein KME11_01080 [Timaviella obliquedivisa GSE-PSE-MK23-08B]|jgi:hypothetical protein|nr:hypothetical protein [Timaviella obliquedivisa GSE-PSE-MK23-08B]